MPQVRAWTQAGQWHGGLARGSRVEHGESLLPAHGRGGLGEGYVQHVIRLPRVVALGIDRECRAVSRWDRAPVPRRSERVDRRT